MNYRYKTLEKEFETFLAKRFEQVWTNTADELRKNMNEMDTKNVILNKMRLDFLNKLGEDLGLNKNKGGDQTAGGI